MDVDDLTQGETFLMGGSGSERSEGSSQIVLPQDSSSVPGDQSYPQPVQPEVRTGTEPSAVNSLQHGRETAGEGEHGAVLERLMTEVAAAYAGPRDSRDSTDAIRLSHLGDVPAEPSEATEATQISTGGANAPAVVTREEDPATADEDGGSIDEFDQAITDSWRQSYLDWAAGQGTQSSVDTRGVRAETRVATIALQDFIQSGAGEPREEGAEKVAVPPAISGPSTRTVDTDPQHYTTAIPGTRHTGEPRRPGQDGLIDFHYPQFSKSGTRLAELGEQGSTASVHRPEANESFGAGHHGISEQAIAGRSQESMNVVDKTADVFAAYPTEALAPLSHRESTPNEMTLGPEGSSSLVSVLPQWLSCCCDDSGTESS